MIKILLLLCISFILPACATSQPLLKTTSSGYPEGIFRNTSVDKINSKIMDGCTSNGLIIYEATANQVVCGKTTSGMDAVLGQLVVGNSYSTTPERKVRFSVFQQGNDVKVVVYEWIESQMAFGQIRRQPLEANHQKNSMQQFLFSLGADNEDGKTSAAYRPVGWLGIQVNPPTKNDDGMVISDMVKGGPAEKGGLKTGDVIIEYNDKKIDTPTLLKNMIQMTRPGETVIFTILRNNNLQKIPIMVGEIPQ